jgi:predicted transcriptional regulator of viral defense system
MGRDTLDERIVEHMTRFSDDTFQAMAVTKALDLEPRRVTSVASALVKLAHRGRIKRIGRGEYQGIAP